MKYIVLSLILMTSLSTYSQNINFTKNNPFIYSIKISSETDYSQMHTSSGHVYKVKNNSSLLDSLVVAKGLNMKISSISSTDASGGELVEIVFQ